MKFQFREAPACGQGASLYLRKTISISDHHENRYHLRTGLPREICCRTEVPMNAYEQIRLHIPEEVERLMDNRRILREDVQRTIHHAETTGEKFINPATARSLASLRPDRVTYWVEYNQVGEDYQVHRAYSHRMEMKRGRGR